MKKVFVLGLDITIRATVTIVLTKEMADALLALNTHNRTVVRARVERLKEVLIRGLWEFDGTPVRVGVDGVLYDGQHRLLAISETGIPAETSVVVGLKRKARSSIDTGGTRNPKDVYEMTHGVKIPRDVAARIRCAWECLFEGGAHAVCDEPAFAAAFGLFVESDEKVSDLFARHAKGYSRASILAAFMVAMPANPEQVEAMAARYRDMIFTSETDPMRALRMYANRLSSSGGTKIRWDVFTVALTMIFAALDGVPRGKASSSKTAIPRARALYPNAKKPLNLPPSM